MEKTPAKVAWLSGQVVPERYENEQPIADFLLEVDLNLAAGAGGLGARKTKQCFQLRDPFIQRRAATQIGETKHHRSQQKQQ